MKAISGTEPGLSESALGKQRREERHRCRGRRENRCDFLLRLRDLLWFGRDWRSGVGVRVELGRGKNCVLVGGIGYAKRGEGGGFS